MVLRHWLERVFLTAERVLTALLYPWHLLRKSMRGPVRVPILMYHQVSRPLKGVVSCRDCVSSEAFEAQIRALLDAGYRVIPLKDLVRLLEGSSAEGLDRCVALTFDDGYRDQFVNAYPVLRRYGLPATFFLTTGYIGKSFCFPHLSLDASVLGEGNAPPSGWLPLSWDEVEEMAQNGMEIASHAFSHRSLGCLAPEEIARELQHSKDILEQRLGFRVELFAYPFGSQAYGDFDRGVQAMVRHAGYRGACTTVVGRNAVGTNSFALRRIPIEEGDGPFRLRCKLVGAYDWMGMAKTLWQRLAPRENRVDAVWHVEPDGVGR